MGRVPRDKGSDAEPLPGDPGERTQSTLAGGAAGELRKPPELARGERLAHFVILEPLGEGGMGVVYAAYDPDLDRRVAIKLLSPGAMDERRNQRVARLFREAKAMARLSHPNVATVYEVGLADDQVFIAMELVEGVTLRDWLDAEERSTEEIVDVFVQAGRGLAAAHTAGLVHRDFKPRNVMIGTDGRVRVLDFGLARSGPETSEERDVLADVREDVSPLLDYAITRAGTVIGTPAYMAPEQYLAQAVDARSDQFSFCVALYEALWGERPFGGETIANLSDEVIHGRVRGLPSVRGLSPRRRRALERGLQRARRDRYPSMNALIADLVGDPPTRQRAIWSVGLITLTGALAAGATMLVVNRSKTRSATSAEIAEAQLSDSVDASVAAARANAMDARPAQSVFDANQPPESRPALRKAASPRTKPSPRNTETSPPLHQKQITHSPGHPKRAAAPTAPKLTPMPWCERMLKFACIPEHSFLLGGVCRQAPQQRAKWDREVRDSAMRKYQNTSCRQVAEGYQDMLRSALLKKAVEKSGNAFQSESPQAIWWTIERLRVEPAHDKGPKAAGELPNCERVFALYCTAAFKASESAQNYLGRGGGSVCSALQKRLHEMEQPRLASDRAADDDACRRAYTPAKAAIRKRMGLLDGIKTRTLLPE